MPLERSSSCFDVKNAVKVPDSLLLNIGDDTDEEAKMMMKKKNKFQIP